MLAAAGLLLLLAGKRVAMALRIEVGIPAINQRRMPVTDRNRNTSPEMNTAPSAACQVKPMCSTTA